MNAGQRGASDATETGSMMFKRQDNDEHNPGEYSRLCTGTTTIGCRSRYPWHCCARIWRVATIQRDLYAAEIA